MKQPAKYTTDAQDRARRREDHAPVIRPGIYADPHADEIAFAELVWDGFLVALVLIALGGLIGLLLTYHS